MIQYPPYLSVSEECAHALRAYGICCQVKGSRGAHGARVWICDEDREKFKSQILGKGLVGNQHTFWFTTDNEKCGFYYVSFRVNK